ncbi:DUF1127 domain-containing protein [Aurantimonas sp. VKM B-3413]|uniref:DUF1127 domain-containing protein n=1 Tax=Aurantimonas sp. VKM B-3413 TaxID=2779401 RepID=UPI001E3D78AE|nr:DUF1127 domain-containing protein [Aurantimonas sp. VKM B-3413]MCB8838013.1 DUF1127 domain-containing protein [Aurantimonas sp. VKM B-3413]
MTITARTRTPTLTKAPLTNVRVFVEAARAIVKTIVNRRQAKLLAEMPDYLLKDVGIRRDDIHNALQTVWHEDPTYRLAVSAARRRCGFLD